VPDARNKKSRGMMKKLRRGRASLGRVWWQRGARGMERGSILRFWHTFLLGSMPWRSVAKKTVNIHGRDLLPSRCEDQGACGRVIGHWDVDFNEPGCITWWHWFDDKGCYSSGVRLYHSKLEHLEDYDLWPVMCSTTPRVVQGVHYDGPTSCADFGQGPWGIWHIPDGSCY